MDKELITDMRNKFQSAKATLGLLSQGKNVPKEFIERAKKDLDEVAGLLKRGE